ncbi:MAG: 5-bromo-4-chloroindolyl phosphate hydrolysis family protein [Lachnospiraceae bacterium]|nr:5-bromo-4-chloroindolyl phosphate hydrolysis family protein [Lachnospiraceae bacterium]
MANQNNNQKYNELGDQIKNSVLEALSTGDFTGLSDSIAKSVNVVIGDVGGQISTAAYTAANSAQTGARNAAAAAKAQKYHAEQEARIQRNKQLRAAAMKQNANRLRFLDKYAFSSIVKMICGSLFALCNVAVLTDYINDGDIAGAIIATSLAILWSWLFVSGFRSKALLSDARKIKELVKDKLYVSVSEISASMGLDRKKTLKKIKAVLQKGFFPEGRLDEEETTFIASKAVYDQYLETKKHQQEQAKEDLDKQGVDEEKRATLNSEQLTELNAMMSEGTKAIVRLHELNDDIPGEVITAKLNKTEALLQDIFGRVREHPDQMKNCHKLMEYYLPTMLKLVEAYAEYDKVTEPGPDIIKAKDEIEKTIDTINGAFSELLNKLFRDSVWDVTADARVLQSMLGQDGLAKDEYNDLSVSIADTEI